MSSFNIIFYYIRIFNFCKPGSIYKSRNWIYLLDVVYFSWRFGYLQKQKLDISIRLKVAIQKLIIYKSRNWIYLLDACDSSKVRGNLQKQKLDISIRRNWDLEARSNLQKQKLDISIRQRQKKVVEIIYKSRNWIYLLDLVIKLQRSIDLQKQKLDISIRPVLQKKPL